MWSLPSPLCLTNGYKFSTGAHYAAVNAVNYPARVNQRHTRQQPTVLARKENPSTASLFLVFAKGVKKKRAHPDRWCVHTHICCKSTVIDTSITVWRTLALERWDKNARVLLKTLLHCCGRSCYCFHRTYFVFIITPVNLWTVLLSVDHSCTNFLLFIYVIK